MTARELILEVREKRLGLTQRELAVLLGVDQMTVSKWERGISRPRLKTLRQIAALGDVPVAAFFDEVAA